MDADIQPTKKFDFGTHKVYQRKLVIWIWNLDQTGWWKWIFTPFSDGKMLFGFDHPQIPFKITGFPQDSPGAG